MSGGPISTIDEVRERISTVVVAPATDPLVDAFAALDDLKARVMEGLVSFVRSGGHDVDGFGSPIGWLRAHVPMTAHEAARWVAQARCLAQWPTLAALFHDRQLNPGQIEVVCRAVPKPLVAFYAEHDAEVSPLLVGLCIDDTQTAIRDWVAKADAVMSPDPSEAIDPDQPLDPAAHLRVSPFGTDRTALSGELDSGNGAIVAHALAVATRPDRDGEERLVSQRNAEALRDICAHYLAHHPTRRRARNHPHLNLTVDLPGLYKAILAGRGVHTADQLEVFLAARSVSLLEEAVIRHALATSTGRPTTVDGHTLPPAVVTTIFGTGSTISRVLMADGEVLDHGRRVRCATGPLRDAVLIRDTGCRFPTSTGDRCDAPAVWIDGHHLTHWRHGGHTDLDNTLAVCARHHGVVHRDGWTIGADPATGAVTITRPDGRTTTGPPRAARPPDLPLHHPALDSLTPHPPPDDAAHTVTATIGHHSPGFAAALEDLADALLSDEPGGIWAWPRSPG